MAFLDGVGLNYFWSKIGDKYLSKATLTSMIDTSSLSDSNTKIPSSKLVKTGLDAKIDDIDTEIEGYTRSELIDDIGAEIEAFCEEYIIGSDSPIISLINAHIIQRNADYEYGLTSMVNDIGTKMTDSDTEVETGYTRSDLIDDIAEELHDFAPNYIPSGASAYPIGTLIDNYVNEAGGYNSGLVDLCMNKQDLLVSGTNIKTINNTSLLGSGDITIEGSTPEAISDSTIDTICV